MSLEHYIDNQWQASSWAEDIPVQDPSTGISYARIARGTADDLSLIHI